MNMHKRLIEHAHVQKKYMFFCFGKIEIIKTLENGLTLIRAMGSQKKVLLSKDWVLSLCQLENVPVSVTFKFLDGTT